jgi:hypothetical protein
MMSVLIVILLNAGMAYLSAGRIDEAASHARKALALILRMGTVGSAAHALCLTGNIAATRGAEDAESYYHQAMALAEPRGMRPLVAHCHLGLGRLYRRMDWSEQAHEQIDLATTMYREMDMTHWLEQAQGELRSLC